MNEEWQTLLETPESRGFEIKSGWPDSGSVPFGRLLRSIAAIANSGGGKILFGVHGKAENVPSGIPENEIKKYDVSDKGQLVNSYFDPPIDLQIRISPQTSIGQFAVMEITGFEAHAKVPHVAKREYTPKAEKKEGLPNNCLVRKAAVYVRTADAQTVEVSSAEDMRRLIERALFSRQTDLLDSFRRMLSDRTEETKANDRFPLFLSWTKETQFPKYQFAFALQPLAQVKTSRSTLFEFFKSLDHRIIQGLMVHEGKPSNDEIVSTLGDTTLRLFVDGWAFWCTFDEGQISRDEKIRLLRFDDLYHHLSWVFALSFVLSRRLLNGGRVKVTIRLTGIKETVPLKHKAIAFPGLFKQMGHIAHSNELMDTTTVDSEIESVLSGFDSLCVEMEAFYSLVGKDTDWWREVARRNLESYIRDWEKKNP